MNDLHFTIGELAKAANTTPRTIRYYTAEGLLPPPYARGRYALYSADHLARLQLIARLKESYLPLNEIQARIAPLSTEQVEQFLAEPEDASAYIAQVLGSPRRIVPPQPPQAADEPPFAPRAAMLHEQRQPYAAAPPAPERPALRLGYAETRPAPHSSDASPSMLRRLVPQRPPRAAEEEQQVPGERWQRIVLAPGVELHMREPVAEAEREPIEQLIAAARTLFE